MTKPTVTLMTGLPASGKSTVARQMGITRLNLDDMRAAMGFTRQSWSRGQEDIVKEMLLTGIDAAVERGQDIVVDNTHLTAAFPNKMRIKVAGRANFVVFDLLDVPVEECIKRDCERANPVGETVIRKMAKTSAGARKNGWRLTPEWMNVWPQVVPYGRRDLPGAAIIDLDGTLAVHVDRGPYEMEKLESDLPNAGVRTLITYYRRNGAQIILLSGRKEKEDNGFDTRAATVRWLERHQVSYDHLYMRSEGDNRGDFIVKYELFDKHIRDKYDVLTVLDDRDQVIRIWRQMGLPAWQVGYGNF